MQRYEEHELSRILPMMGEADLNELAADISLNGLRAPITLYEGKILDGRNRYKACQMVKIVPRFRDLNGDGDPLAFVISANITRRHLTESQRAVIAAKLANMRRGEKKVDGSHEEPMISQSDAAKRLNVSRRSVTTAKQVLQEAPPSEVAKIERGEKTVTQVARETKAGARDPHRWTNLPADIQKQVKSGEMSTGEANALYDLQRQAPTDRTGYPIPESILEDWRRAKETAQQLLSKISDVRSWLKGSLAEADIIFAEVTNTTIADLDNAYTSIKCVAPYAVCTSCQGHNRKRCSLCKGRGFISEFAWRSFVPAEIKKMRGGK